MNRTRAKICCIASVAEAQLAISAGADALGLVAEMPSGPGPIDDKTAREIANFAPPPLATFLLTSRTEATDIIDHVRYVKTNTVQIVSHIDPSEHELIKAKLPGVSRVQVIHVENDTALEHAAAYAPYVDALLLDSGRPNAAVPELGGTGRAHDWQISRRIVATTDLPVFLAGGLNPENVQEAVNAVQPFGVDLCSGVRTNGQLDAEKLRAFMLGLAGGRDA